MKVLIVEDSDQIVEAVSLCIQLRWPEAIISSAAEGNQGLSFLTREPFDLVILDINLPDIDGFEVLKQIRASLDVSVIILTVRGREDDQAKGLELGADDYIVKPFRPKDLVARVHAVLRRSHAYHMNGEQTLGASLFRSDADTDRIERMVKLTHAEARLLYFMIEKLEHVITSEPVPKNAWGKVFSNPDELKTSIRKLQDKLSESLQRTNSSDHPGKTPPPTNPD